MSFSAFQELYKFDKEWQARAAYARMRRTQPLNKGACQFCERNTESLFPIVVDCCHRCSKDFAARGVKLIQIKRYHRRPGTCIRCGALVTKLYQWNPDVCEKCIHVWDVKNKAREVAAFG
jgi:hypothetical protein